MKPALLILLLIFAFLGGCSKQNSQVITKDDTTLDTALYTNIENSQFNNINDLSDYLTKELLQNHIALDKKVVLVTSFVDLNQLNQTSDFGRALGEKMISNLHKKGFRVKEYRGQNAISINSSGEFYITRDIKKLPKEIEADYVFIGTYTEVNANSLSINARIVDFVSGDIYATATANYIKGAAKTLNSSKNIKEIRYVEIIKDDK